MFVVQRISDGKYWRNTGGIPYRPAEDKYWSDTLENVKPYFTKNGASGVTISLAWDTLSREWRFTQPYSKVKPRAQKIAAKMFRVLKVRLEVIEEQ